MTTVKCLIDKGAGPSPVGFFFTFDLDDLRKMTQAPDARECQLKVNPNERRPSATPAKR